MRVLAILFFLGALYAGFLLFDSHRRKVKPLEFVVTTHISCATLGVLCLIVSLLLQYEKSVFYSLLLFLATGSGGLFLFKKKFSDEIKPLAPIVAHASLGLAALTALALTIFK